MLGHGVPKSCREPTESSISHRCGLQALRHPGGQEEPLPRGAPWRTLTASYPSTSCFIPTACSTEFQFPKSSVGRVVGGLQQLLGWDQVGPRGETLTRGCLSSFWPRSPAEPRAEPR